MTKYTINDFTTKFQYKDLTPIVGQPTLETILRLYRQVKRNAQSVDCKLGGGQLGYLGLVLSEDDYNMIPGTVPFVRPTDPGTFTARAPRTGTQTRAGTPSTSSTTTAIDIANQKSLHEELERRYWECQAVEQALRNQIIAAMDSDYLDAIRNPTTDMIHETIPEIFKYLQTTYGRITIQELSDKEDQLKNMTYDPQTPVDTVFNKLNWFQDLCILSKNKKTDTQLVHIAYLIFNRTRAFMDILLKWNKKESEDKTYQNFKLHMREGHNALRNVGALTVQDSSINSANLLQEVTAHQEKMADDIKTSVSNQLQQSLLEALMVMQPSAQHTEDTSTITAPSMNSASTTSFDSLITMFKNLEKKMDDISTNKNKGDNDTYNSLTDKINPHTGKPWKRYCWSCGCTTHKGRDCPNKKEGHKDEASFKNRMGGSNKNCYPPKK